MPRRYDSGTLCKKQNSISQQHLEDPSLFRIPEQGPAPKFSHNSSENQNFSTKDCEFEEDSFNPFAKISSNSNLRTDSQRNPSSSNYTSHGSNRQSEQHNSIKNLNRKKDESNVSHVGNVNSVEEAERIKSEGNGSIGFYESNLMSSETYPSNKNSGSIESA